MLTESFEERLKWIDPNHYERHSEQIIVKEAQEDGKATIFCEVSNDVIKMNFESQKRIKYLKQQKVADTVLFEFIDTKSVKLHIIECKSTVKADDWNNKIKLQFEGGLLNALAFMGILGLSDIRAIMFYTFYRKEEISTQSIPNPLTLKALPEKKRDDVEKRLKAKREWENDYVSILSIKNAHHQKIRLNDNREARITLNKNQTQSE
jgi:hypothetical protein